MRFSVPLDCVLTVQCGCCHFNSQGVGVPQLYWRREPTALEVLVGVCFDDRCVTRVYPLLSAAFCQLMNDNWGFNVSRIFWGVALIDRGWQFQNNKYPLLPAICYHWFFLATSQLMGIKYLMFSSIFTSLLMKDSFISIKINHYWLSHLLLPIGISQLFCDNKQFVRAIPLVFGLFVGAW